MAERRDFRQWIVSHRAVGDGAMATWLHQMGVPARACYEELCLSAPQLIEQVHRQYIEAGADIVQTNTFNAHRPGLERYGIAEKMEEINRAAVRLARKAAGTDTFVFATVGSILGLQPGLLPWDTEMEEKLRTDFQNQIRVLLEEEIDGILLETFADFSELELALRVARDLTNLPLIAHLSPETPGVTRDGVPLSAAFRDLRSAGADVVGLNCQLGVARIVQSFEKLELPVDGAFSAYPNAGMLERSDDNLTYTANADYFGESSKTLFELGVQLVGGCCGTTPEHIKAIVQARAAATSHAGVKKKSLNSSGFHSKPKIGPTFAERTFSGDCEPNIVDVAKERLTVIVELDPPRTLDTQKFMEGARVLHDAGADYITLADNSLGHVRVSNLALASQLVREGIRPLVHITCRDRNLIGQQSHLMGLHVLNIHHILLVTGDPSRFGDLPGSSSVYDTSSTQLTAMVKRLNQGVAFSGEHLSHNSNFVVGTSFNPNVKNPEKAYQRLQRKIQAGADYVMTQPLFSKEQIRELALCTRNLSVPVFVGIMPLVSARNANFLHHEVPGVQIPEAVLARMNHADPGQAAAEGLTIAKELLDEVMKYFHTIYLITPFLRYTLTQQLVKYARQSAAAAVKSASISNGL